MVTIIPGRPSVATISTSSVVLVPRNPGRIMLCIVNTGVSVCCLGLGSDLAFGSGIYLVAAGGSFMIDRNNPFYGEVYAISTGAGSTLAIQEVSYG